MSFVLCHSSFVIRPWLFAPPASRRAMARLYIAPSSLILGYKSFR
ncbi:hypothetical protein [Coleofasciculus sp. F4-SAH-05]